MAGQDYLCSNAVQARAIQEDAEGDNDRVAHLQIGAWNDWDRAAAGAILEVCEVLRTQRAQVQTLHK